MSKRSRRVRQFYVPAPFHPLRAPIFGAVLIMSAGLGGMSAGAVASPGVESRSAAPVPDASSGAAQQALADRRAWRERRASGEERERRRLSRSAHRRLGRQEALALGRSAHPRVLRDRAPRALAFAQGRYELERFEGDYAAVLRPADGAAGPAVMASSLLPLRARDERNETRVVDLSLEARGEGWASDNPRVGISFGRRASDGLTVDRDGVGLAPVGLAADPEGELSGDAVFYANTAADTDHVLRPTPGGAEFYAQLRSTASPERLRYRVRLPQGASVRATGDGGAEVLRDDERLGQITRPLAWDADDEPVPVDMSVVGDELVVEVPHRIAT